MRQSVLRLIVLTATLAATSLARAQDQNPNPFDQQSADGGVIGQFDPSISFGGSEPATIEARVTAPTADQPAILLITAQVEPGKHTYSVTQPPGGPMPTKIELAPSKDYRLLAAFQPATPPKSHVDNVDYKGVKIEEHEGTVTWYAPVEISAGVDAKKLKIDGKIQMLVCGTTCVPVFKVFSASQSSAGAAGIRVADWPPVSAVGHAQSTVASFQMKGSSAKFSGRLVPSAVRPGESAELHITASVPPTFHIYAYSDRDKPTPFGPRPTLIALQSTGGLLPQRPTTDAKIKVDTSVPEFGPSEYHEGDVTWTQKIEVPKDAKAGEYSLEGLIGYQVCMSGPNGGNCERPTALLFATKLTVGAEQSKTDAPLTFAPGDIYPKVAAAAAALADFYGKPGGTTAAPPAGATSPNIEAANAAPPVAGGKEYDLSRISLQNAASGSLWYYIAIAFVGGLILNLMPCVLPVIGLKVMSFVEQSGKSRSRAFMLNMWFSAGIISVFLVLAVLASLPHLGWAKEGLGWGGQNGSVAFNATIAAVVFAMALSLLGVWEIPIPGFFGSGSVQSAASKEGALGAFLKGVVTTVLATPCTAPLMAAAITWAVSQAVITTLIVFATVGLGMASPYLVIGVFPELLRFLPKPGAWMETFKQVSGFLLLGTVVYILSYIDPSAVLPTLILLLGVGIACWYLARTPMTAEFGARLRSWAGATIVLLLFIGVAFGIMYRLPVANDWQPFSLARLHQVAVNEGKTVLVDFSAEWCPSCKVFEKLVLHTKPVEQAIQNSGAVTMYADYTGYSPEIKRTINALGSEGIPVIAIFPAGSPYKPIVFINGYRKQDIISALDEAKKSRANTQVSNEQRPPTFTPAVIR